MITAVPTGERLVTEEGPLNLGYVWLISFVAALGGLLFGYDWVVIGGAKPFYEAFFHLYSASLIGWANSCALIGCFVGSLAAGRLSDQYGRRPVLFIAALLFAISSVLTGWSYSFSAFVAWRILGGTAIGLASNVSPLYIAEVSPASWRGRLVSLNQLAIVVGILMAQVANWRIARPVPVGITEAAMSASWNAQLGWRWMFTAVAVPAIAFVCAAPFIPESPRWLMGRGHDQAAEDVLTRIGGGSYASREMTAIRSTRRTVSDAPWRLLFRKPFRVLVLSGIALAVLQQGSGINVLFNYAEEVYRSAGYGLNSVLFNIVLTGAINLVFTLVAMLLVDRFGRRKLMLFGAAGVGLAHALASLAFYRHLQGPVVLVLTLGAIACYAMSLAPVTWVLIAEIFPNQVRASAVAVSVAALWVSSFVLTYTFPLLDRAFGTAGTFLSYSVFCFLGFAFVFFFIPETKGRSLEQIGEAETGSAVVSSAAAHSQQSS